MLAAPPALLRRHRRAACAVALLGMAIAAATGLARAAGDDDRRALAARQTGRIVPLATLIADVDAAVPGRLLDAELDDEDGIPVYELRWQLADGRRLEIEVDARDGRWRKLEGPRLETAFRRSSGGPR